MSVLYNAFRAAAPKETSLDARSMFQAEIADTFYELEETFLRSLDQKKYLANYEETQTDHGTIHAISIHLNADDPLLNALSAEFDKQSDFDKVIKAHYKAVSIDTPSLIIFTPHRKGACQVFTSEKPYTEGTDLNDLKDLTAITTINHGDYHKLSQTIGSWLKDSFPHDIEALSTVFTGSVQQAQSELQCSASPENYYQQVRKSVNFMKK